MHFGVKATMWRTCKSYSAWPDTLYPYFATQRAPITHRRAQDRIHAIARRRLCVPQCIPCPRLTVPSCRRLCPRAPPPRRVPERRADVGGVDHTPPAIHATPPRMVAPDVLAAALAERALGAHHRGHAPQDGRRGARAHGRARGVLPGVARGVARAGHRPPPHRAVPDPAAPARQERHPHARLRELLLHL